MSPPPAATLPEAGARMLGAKVALAFAGLQLLLLLQPGLVELDPEELYNAAHAELVVALGPAALFPPQYRPYCGGCTLDAALGALLRLALPASLLTWKLVPIGLGAVALGLLARGLGRRVSAEAGLAFAVVAVWTPPAWSRLGLVAWGNHYEASAAVLVALAAALEPPGRGRRLLLGLALGLALWIGLSAAFALPVLLGWLLVRGEARHLPAALAGLLLGYAPALLRLALTGESPLATVYEEGEALPLLSRLPDKLATLLPPRQLAGLLGLRHPVLGPPAGIAAALAVLAAAVAALRRPGPPRLVAALLAGWLGVYLLVRFQVAVSPPGVVPTAGDVRYAAPALALAMPLLALVAAAWWREGARGRAALLLAPAVLAGCGARLAALAPPFPVPAALAMRAADLEYARDQLAWALPLDLHRRGLAEADAPQARHGLPGLHAYALGRAAVAASTPDGANPPDPATAPALALPATLPVELLPAWAEGVAAAAVDQADPEADGDRADLERAVARLLPLVEAWPPDARQAALRHALWRRVDGGAPDAPLAAATSEEGLRRLSGEALGRLDPAVRAALWHAAGRRWGRDRAARWQPGDLPLPVDIAGERGAGERGAGEPGAGEAFAEGLGEALGARWGPAAASSPPAALPAPWRTAYARGVATGLARWWR